MFVSPPLSPPTQVGSKAFSTPNFMINGWLQLPSRAHLSVGAQASVELVVGHHALLGLLEGGQPGAAAGA
jgi:hypothetical protein